MPVLNNVNPCHEQHKRLFWTTMPAKKPQVWNNSLGFGTFVVINIWYSPHIELNMIVCGMLLVVVSELLYFHHTQVLGEWFCEVAPSWIPMEYNEGHYSKFDVEGGPFKKLCTETGTWYGDEEHQWSLSCTTENYWGNLLTIFQQVSEASKTAHSWNWM